MVNFKLFPSRKNKIKEGFAASVPSKTISLSESFKGVESNPEESSFYKSKVGVMHPFDWELLEHSYLSIPIIQGSIDKHVDFVLGSEYKIESEDEKVKKRFIEFVEDHDFDVLLRLIVRNMLIFGSAFLEIVWGGRKVKEVKLLDSKTMFVRRDSKGKLLGYTQYLGNSKVMSQSIEPIYFKPDEIVHFAFNNIGGSPYGTSVIRSLFGAGDISIVKQFLTMEQSMNSLLQRQVNAKLHVKMGDENNHPTQEDIDDLASKLESAKNNTEWITSFLVNMDVLGYEGKILDLSPFASHYEDQMIYGLQTPYVLLGKGRVPEGLALVQLEAFERRIKSIQLAVSRELENKLLNSLLGVSKYHFVWCRHERKELDELNILIRFIADKFVLTDETRNVIENRIRNLLSKEALSLKEYKSSLKASRDEKQAEFEANQDQFNQGGQANNFGQSNDGNSSKSDKKPEKKLEKKLEKKPEIKKS